jgi:hypothetical protein
MDSAPVRTWPSLLGKFTCRMTLPHVTTSLRLQLARRTGKAKSNIAAATPRVSQANDALYVNNNCVLDAVPGSPFTAPLDGPIGRGGTSGAA